MENKDKTKNCKQKERFAVYILANVRWVYSKAIFIFNSCAFIDHISCPTKMNSVNLPRGFINSMRALWQLSNFKRNRFVPLVVAMYVLVWAAFSMFDRHLTTSLSSFISKCQFQNRWQQQWQSNLHLRVLSDEPNLIDDFNYSKGTPNSADNFGYWLTSFFTLKILFEDSKNKQEYDKRKIPVGEDVGEKKKNIKHHVVNIIFFLFVYYCSFTLFESFMLSNLFFFTIFRFKNLRKFYCLFSLSLEYLSNEYINVFSYLSNKHRALKYLFAWNTTLFLYGRFIVFDHTFDDFDANYFHLLYCFCLLLFLLLFFVIIGFDYSWSIVMKCFSHTCAIKDEIFGYTDKKKIDVKTIELKTKTE